MKKIVLLILLLFVSEVYAQFEKNRLHFTVKDGLPSNEVYKVYKDSIGYYWFATDRGVARFNGYNFTSFGLYDNLPDIVIFDIKPDKQGRIWFMGMNAMLGYYTNGKFYKYKYNEKIKEFFKSTKIMGGQNLFYVDSAGNITYSHIFADKVIRIDTSGNIKVVYENKNLDKRFLSSNANFFIIKSKNNYKLEVFDNKNGTKKQFSLDDIEYAGVMPNSINPYFNDSMIYINLNKHILIINTLKNQLKILNNKHYVNSITKIQDKISAASFNGIYILHNNVKILNNYKFKGEQISYLYTLNDKSFWACTVGNGAYYYPSGNSIKLLSDKNIKNINIYTSKNNQRHLYFISSKYLYHSTGNSIYRYKITPAIITDYVTMNILDTNRIIINNQIYLIKNGELREENRRFWKRSDKSRCLTRYKSKYFLLTSDILFEKNLNSSIKLLSFTNFIANHFDIYSDTIWLATSSGIYTYSLRQNNTEKYNTVSDINDFNISQIINISDSLLIIGTKGKGIYIFNKKKKSVVRIFNEKSNLSGDVIKQLLKYKDFIFVGTQNGIDIINLKKLALIKIKQILPAHSEINKLKIIDSDLYVAFNSGLIKHPVGELFNTNDSKNYILQI